MSTRISIIKKSMLNEELQRMISYKPLQYLISTIVVGLLMMFLTLIVGLSSHLTDVSSWLTDKLGMYFYISSSVAPETVNTKIVGLMKELETANIQAEYFSQEEAMSALQKRLPDIAKTFQDYNINAQLPATLYVTIPNEQSHAALVEILPRYADMIENTADLSNSSLKNQEQRVMRALEFAYFLRGASIVLIVLFSLVMIGVVLLVLYFKLKQFEDVLHLKKVLWATHAQMRNPFIMFVGLVLWGWYIVSLALTTLIGIGSMGTDRSLVYFSQLLWVDGMQTGIRGLLFGGYLSVIALVFIIGAIVWFISTILIEKNIRKAF